MFSRFSKITTRTESSKGMTRQTGVEEIYPGSTEETAETCSYGLVICACGNCHCSHHNELCTLETGNAGNRKKNNYQS